MSKATSKGFETIIKNMEALKNASKEATVSACEEASSNLYAETAKLVRLTDHDLKSLAKEGHPYSADKPKDTPHPDYMIHLQSGNLFDNLRRLCSVIGNKVKISVGVSEEEVPYIGYLINGTSKMRPRDFLTQSAKENLPKVEKQIKYGLSSKIKSNVDRNIQK